MFAIGFKSCEGAARQDSSASISVSVNIAFVLVWPGSLSITRSLLPFVFGPAFGDVILK